MTPTLDALNPNQQQFVRNIVAGLTNTKAYMGAYPDCTTENSAKVSASRLLTDDNVQAAIRELSQQITEQAAALTAERRSANENWTFLTAAQKRNLLYQTATGQLSFMEARPMFDPIEKKFVAVNVQVFPSFSERLRAIELDNKMSGDETPDPIAGTTNILQVFNLQNVPHELKLEFVKLIGQLEQARGE